MVAVGQRAESFVYGRDKVANEYLVEAGSVGTSTSFVRTTTERSFHISTLHHHNHGQCFTLCNEVVHDVLHVALLTPARFVFAHTML